MIVAQTAMTTTRKTRPPQLSIPVVGRPPQPAALVVDQSPSDLPPPFTDSELQLSPTSASPSSSEPSPLDENLLYVDADEDDVSREWVDLRRRFKSNLRLRPIGSSSALSSLAREHAQQAEADLPLFDRVDSSSSSATTTTAESDPDIASPTSSVVTSHSSVYFTPISATPISAYYIGSPAPAAKIDYSTYHTPRTPSPRASRAVDPAELLTRLRAPTQPLLIDTRPLPAYLHSHIYHSANVAIPTLILKRSRKGGGFQSLDVLRQYITTDAGKRAWDELMGPEGEWDGDIVLYDEDMNEQEQENPQATAWALRPLLKRLVGRGTVDWLHGGINAVYSTPSLRPYISSGEPGSATDKVPFAFPFPTPPSQPGSGRKPGGLFQLNTQAAARSRTMPMVDSNPPTPDRSASPDARVDAIDLLEADQPAHSPLPMMSSLMVRARDQFLDDASPSPAPSQVAFNRPKPPSRRPSVPSLRQLDTRSHERLPKLSVRPVPSKSLTLAVPPSATAEHAPALLRPPRSPSHLTLAHSNHSSPTGSALGAPPGAWFSPTANASAERLPPPTPTFGRPPPSPRTPRTAMSLPPSPLTARPTPMTSQPPTSETEEAFGEFMISGILPNFLFLGPEPTTEEHVQELLGLGVKRILNLACECDDDTGLRLRQRFERYTRIPMRDTVEEDNITQGVREACEVLDDARLHSAPTYVHCKAGKSRSVTAVMAYLIHANRWTLSRAYAFVLERRKGISPNIGFVSELMGFEQQELGSKSMGVVKQPSNSDGDGHSDSAGGAGSAGAHGGGGGMGAGTGMGGQYGVAVGSRRPAHMRESLPPMNRVDSENLLMGAYVQPGEGALQEMEIKDAEGRYRHIRRAPVDERSLQPVRRVSKAGLESSGWFGRED